MESGIKIDNEIANLIIKLCFSINELKKEYKPNEKHGHQFFTTYDDVKNRMDDILHSTTRRTMLTKIKELQGFTKNSLRLYKMLPKDFKSRDQTLQTLNSIVNQLTALEKLISD